MDLVIPSAANLGLFVGAALVLHQVASADAREPG